MTRQDWQIKQGVSCGCKGTEEMCPCQNVNRLAPPFQNAPGAAASNLTHEQVAELIVQVETRLRDEFDAELKDLLSAAQGIEALIDEQTYDERRRADFDMPDDAELCVMVPAGMFRKLRAAVDRKTKEVSVK